MQSLPFRESAGRPARQRADTASDRQLAFSWEAPVPRIMQPQSKGASIVSGLLVREDAIARDEETCRAALERSLARALGVKIVLGITANRRTMISTRRAGDTLRVRLHRMFLEADPTLLDSLGRYVKTGDRGASRRLGEFIERHRDRFVAPRPAAALRTDGHVHDLREVFCAIERRWFAGELDGVAITWGKQSAHRRRVRKRSIRLGTYTHDERLIRVHPVLDQPWVPRFFLEYIVFHEMLHHVEPPREEEGRTIFHTPAFREREQAYPDYERALRWERLNIDRLLGS